MPLDDSVESLHDRIRSLEAELTNKSHRVSQLEKVNKELSTRIEGMQGTQPTADLAEMDETLRRLVMRIAMIVQGTKCLYMVHDAATNELYADRPALGFEDAELERFRFPADRGVSGECFQTNQPVILYSVEDERLAVEGLSDLGVTNGLCVPLIVEKRDEETNRVLERKTIGVLWVFNKKFGNIFIEEDIQLLERLAKNAAAVINTASKWHQVVQEKEELAETIQALTAGLIMVARNGRVTQMNHSARRIFGIADNEPLAGRTYDQVIKDEKILEILRNGLSDEAGVTEEVQLTLAAELPEGDLEAHTFQIQTATVRNELGEGIGTAAIFNDITELKNIDKMKTAFVSTVSHELRTPLTSIKGFSSTLLMDEDGTLFDIGSRREFYTIIDTECDRLKRLIDDLLNVSRIESGNALQLDITEFDLHEAIPHVLVIAEGSTYKKSNHKLTFSLSEDLPHRLWGDRDKIEQIFHNLIGNALKYSPEGGEVKVSGSVMPGGELVHFAISDQGMGMTKEQAAKMGERFYRVDNRDTRKIGGTGIGLFLVKNFVQMHGGQLWVESEVGKGSTFHITLAIKTEDSDDGQLARNVAA